MSPRWMFSPALPSRWVRIAAVVALAGVLSVAPGVLAEADPTRSTRRRGRRPALARPPSPLGRAVRAAPRRCRRRSRQVKQVGQRKNTEGISNSGAYYFKEVPKVDTDTIPSRDPLLSCRTPNGPPDDPAHTPPSRARRAPKWEMARSSSRTRHPTDRTRGHAPRCSIVSAANLSRGRWRGHERTGAAVRPLPRRKIGRVHGDRRRMIPVRGPARLPSVLLAGTSMVFRERYDHQINFDSDPDAVRCDPESCADLLKTRFEGLWRGPAWSPRPNRPGGGRRPPSVGSQALGHYLRESRRVPHESE